MTHKVYTVTDLGPGDGGKGGVVHRISSMTRAHTIIKVGGAQGSHGVRTAAGDAFAFSQFGCGTFEGARTHLTPLIVAAPDGLLNEADALQHGCGIADVDSLLSIDERVICATPFHGVASRIKELARGNNPRGTIGTGVGEAYRYASRFPDLTITASELTRPDLKDQLAAVREKVCLDLAFITNADLLAADREEATAELALLTDTGFLDYVVERFRETARRFQIVDSDYLKREIFARDGVVVVESSHGILTDRFHGFHPHTSAIRTLPCFTHEMLADAGYTGEIRNLGVSRAYQIRHGAGPMPTDDPSMREQLLPGSHKEENRYQGKVRVGPLDLMLLRYAIAVCGGPSAFDGLAITWFDQIQKNGAWHLCTGYDGVDGSDCFTSDGSLRIRRGTDNNQLAFQEAMGRALTRVTPRITTHTVSGNDDRETLYSLCDRVLSEALSVNVCMLSFGPTERDKLCK